MGEVPWIETSADGVKDFKMNREKKPREKKPREKKSREKKPREKKSRNSKRKQARLQRKIDANTKGLVEPENSGRRRHRRRRIILIIAIIVAVLVVIGIAVFFFLNIRTYTNYRELASSNQEDTVSTSYIELNDKLFKYNASSANLEDNEGNISWTSTYEMQSPIADECNGTIAVADQGGTLICIFNSEGLLGYVETSMSIVKVKVAEQGIVAAILDGGDDTWIDFFATDGTLIAENQTRVNDPGYPLDLAVSQNGILIMVAYQFVSGEETTSYVAFYNFSTAGQSVIDNIVSGYQYQGILIPEVEALDSNTFVAFRDDGFSIYSGSEVPEETANVQVEEEIISTFYDENNIGLVFKNDDQDSDSLYTMKVYNTAGSMKFERDFNIAYNSIRISDGDIIMFNESQVCVINSNGQVRYNGNLDEGSIRDFFKIGLNRYVVVLDGGVKTIRFT